MENLTKSKYAKKNLRELKDVFIRKYKEGNSINDIAKEFNVAGSSVKRYLRESNIIRPKNRAIVFKDDIYEDYIKGCSLRYMANKYKSTTGTIKRILIKEFDVTFSPSEKYAHLLETFKKDYLNGDSSDVIAKRYGLNKQTVLDYINADGVKSRDYFTSSRKYDINDNYFSSLNKEKSYIMGQVFYYGYIIKTSNSDALELSANYSEKESLLSVISRFSDKEEESLEKDTKSNAVRIRIYSNQIVKDLSTYGLSSKSKSSINNKKIAEQGDIDQFYEGFIKLSISFNKRNIYFKSNHYTESLIDYLEVYKDLNGYNISPNMNIYIERFNDICNMFDKLPYIKEAFLETYPNNLEGSKWDKIYRVYNK